MALKLWLGRRFTLAALFAFLVVLKSPIVHADGSGQEPSTGQSINNTYSSTVTAAGIEPFKTWSLFLVCNPAWLSQKSTVRLEALYDQFRSFGWVIGPDNLAVWFRPDKHRTGTTARGPAIYDAERASLYCAKYKLASAASPHVVVTDRYPDGEDTGRQIIVALGDADSAVSMKILTELTDQIRKGNIRQDDINLEIYWRGWEQIGRNLVKIISPVFSRLSFSINAGALKVELGAVAGSAR